MKIRVGILIAGILALSGCNNHSKEKGSSGSLEQVDAKQEFSRLNEFLKKFEEPTQTFKVPSEKLIKVTGRQGTVIQIDPVDLETESGEPIGNDVDIDLKELTNQQQLLRANAQTVSDGQLLVSGGAYFINVTSAGQQVKLKEGKTYSAQFPKISDDEMSLFYGERDSSDKMNWKKAEQNLEVVKPGQDSEKEYNAVIVTGSGKFSDTSIVPMKNVTKEEANKIIQEQKVYNPATISKFGWINCDRFYDLNAPATNVHYTITNRVEDVNYVNIYLIFQDIRSVIQSSYNFYDNPDKNIFSKIPVGLDVRFLAVCYQNGKIFATITNVKQVTNDHNEKLSLQQMNEGDFDIMIRSIE